MTKQNNAASLAVKPLHCPNCWHDPAPVDVFDRIQEQARATRRATCACGHFATMGQTASVSKAIKVRWVACLLKESQPLPDGITTTCYERLPGLFKTSDKAMDAGEAAIALRPDAVGYSAVRVEVPHGA